MNARGSTRPPPLSLPRPSVYSIRPLRGWSCPSLLVYSLPVVTLSPSNILHFNKQVVAASCPSTRVSCLTNPDISKPSVCAFRGASAGAHPPRRLPCHSQVAQSPLARALDTTETHYRSKRPRSRFTFTICCHQGRFLRCSGQLVALCCTPGSLSATRSMPTVATTSAA